jgi:Secretion system C-terminal sorting domain
MIIKENLFDEPWINLEGANDGTNILCNKWTNNSTGSAIEVLEGSTLPKSWGDPLTVSGNINDNNPRPLFTFPGSGNALYNYYNNSETAQRFTYYGLVSGKNINAVNHCATDVWPPSPPPVDPYWSDIREDLGDLDEEYSDADDVLDGYYSDLHYLTGSAAANKREQIGQVQIGMDDIIRRALKSAQASDSNEIDTWLDRVDPKLIALTNYFSMWYNGDFSIMSARLDLIADDDAAALKDAVDYMMTVVSEDESMYELNPTELDDLTDLAEVSYGDYTNILRTFLNAEYGIKIIRSDELIPRGISSKDWEENPESSLRNNYAIVPNPTNDCIRVLPRNNVSNEFTGDVFNSLGNLIISFSSSHSNAFICLSEYAPGLYLIRVIDSKTGAAEVQKIILN